MTEPPKTAPQDGESRALAGGAAGAGGRMLVSRAARWVRAQWPDTPPVARLALGVAVLAAAALALAAGWMAFPWVKTHFGRTPNVARFITRPDENAAWKMPAKTRCGSAPFLFPTEGFIGYLWGDSFQLGHTHQGLDIFAGSEIGVTPVYAAYSGYLTREASWKSSLIIRIPSDPLQPERQIWTYYAHMAGPAGDSFISDAFPPGTVDAPVQAGDLLGYQGDYSGNPANPVGVHLHFSIILDNGQGGYSNELAFQNSLDPSPYFGWQLNSRVKQGAIPQCVAAQETP